MALTPPPAAPQRGDRTTFASRLDAFITWLINFVTELVALVANLNSIAIGGAYAIPFKFIGNAVSNGSAAGGVLAFASGTAQTATQLLVDTKDSAGASIAAALNDFNGSSSAVRGTLRIVKQGDASKWARFAVINYAQNGGGLYGAIYVTPIDSSEGTPFVNNDAVLLQFQRTGDKGQKGDSGDILAPMFHVRDERASGAGGGLFDNPPFTRVLNTVVYNTIAGASLASNRVTLPAGTYEFEGSAPACGVAAHMARLYNETDATLFSNGTSEFTSSATTVVTRSLLRGRFTITATKVFSVQSISSNTGGTNAAGWPVSPPSGNEVYTEILFRKVA